MQGGARAKDYYWELEVEKIPHLVGLILRPLERRKVWIKERLRWSSSGLGASITISSAYSNMANFLFGLPGRGTPQSLELSNETISLM